MKKAIYELDELENLVEEEEEQEDEDEDEEDVVDRGDDFDPDDEDEDEGDDDEDDEINPDEDEEDDEDGDDGSEDDEDESDDADEDDDGEEEDDDPPRIPKGRLDEVIAQREAERERVRWLEEQLETIIRSNDTGKDKPEPEPEPEYDFDDAEERYVDLVLEGDKTEARKLRKEIDNAKEKSLEAKMAKIREESESSAKSVSESALQEQRYEQVIQQSLAKYDFLNHETDAYNAKAVTMANTLMKAYVADGDTKADAMAKAVEEVAPFYDKKATTDSAKAKSKERQRSARRKAADASKKQPKDTGQRGNSKSRRDLDAIKIDKMSERDFDKLTAREKKALRGD